MGTVKQAEITNTASSRERDLGTSWVHEDRRVPAHELLNQLPATTTRVSTGALPWIRIGVMAAAAALTSVAMFNTMNTPDAGAVDAPPPAVLIQTD